MSSTVVSLWIQSAPLLVALLSGPASYLIAQSVAWWALRPYRRESARQPHLHWSERAQLSMPARQAGTTLLIVLPLCLGVGATTTAGELSLASDASLGFTAGLGSFFGTYLSLRKTGEILGFPRSNLLRDLRAFAFLAQGLIAVVTIIIAGRALGDLVVAPRLSSLLVLACTLPWAWPPLVLFSFRAVGALHSSRDLEQQLTPLFERANTRPAHVFIARTSVANALAYPIQKVIVVTERLLEIVEPDELSAIVAHELGHLNEGKKAWTRVSILGFLGAAGFTSALVPADLYVPFIAGATLGTLLIAVGLKKWSRAREHEADAAAVREVSGEAYARALEKIYAANLLPAAQRGGHHPSLYDRMEKAGVTPDFPRPALAPRRIPYGLCCTIFAAIVWSTLWPIAFQTFYHDRPGALAVTTHDAWALGELALRAHQQKNLPEAIALYRRAEQLAPDSPWYPRNLMAVLDEAGHCDEARAASMRAYEKAHNAPEINEYLGPPVRCDEALPHDRSGAGFP